MSALGHQRTLGADARVAALPPKADMLSVGIDVCNVPQADMHLGRDCRATLLAVFRAKSPRVTLGVTPK